ncbi:hypothetical protein [Paeniglutamicibacter kerguelensis]|uniref:Leucine rich repeat variant n=1 Tax=Paeniglutamicibacter kerguelensis TaxID=254788 RepID=A0ABS4XIY9_9MICC|nr:hypothetical protein [Paeniglutamicibacter kerguelensis]MBP2388431.1 hypothetical protein [Paeniglutamicibacter kerguelensis]
MENGPHRAKILTEAFGVAETLLREPSSDSELDRASILLAYCEQAARAGATALIGSVGASCDAVVDGKSFADRLDPLALADITSLMLSNAGQLETWREQIADGDHYEPNPGFAGSGLVGGADADWVIGETLIDCKVYGALTVPKLRDFLRQLLGYVMLDSDDSLGIRHVGIWLPRQGMTPRWSLKRLLGGDPEELLPSLRQGFIKAIGKTQLAPHAPISARRKRQLLADNRHTPYEMLAELALGEDVDLRRRVGRNAVTPEPTLRKLVGDARWQVREGVAMNEAAPEDVLQTLAHDRSIAVRRAVASNPGAPLPLVKALEADTSPDVQWAARTHQGVGTELAGRAPLEAELSSAGGHGAVQISQNRDESALDSQWFDKFLQMTRGFPLLPIPQASRIWGRLSKRQLDVEEWMQAGLPDQVLDDLFRSDRPRWVRRRIAGELPISETAVRESLLSDADPEIRWQALERTLSTKAESLGTLLADLAASPEARLRFRTEGMESIREWWYTAAEYKHRTLCLVAAHPSTPCDALLTLTSSSSTEVLANLIDNPSLGAADRAQLIESLQTSKSVATRELLVSLHSVPESALIDLASDRDVRVRAAVAKHHAAPLAALTHLAADKKREVRLSVLENPYTPGDLASFIAEAMLLVDVDEDLHEVLKLTETRADVDLPPRVIEEALDRLSKSRVRDPDMRVVVAGDGRSGGRTLSRLARSAEDGVRRAVVTNPHTPIAVLERLASDPEPGVRARVAGNPLSPAIVLVALSHDEDPQVRAGTAKNPNLPPSVLESLLVDAEASVGSTALANPATPEEPTREAETELERPPSPSRPHRVRLVEMVANPKAEVRMQVAFSRRADTDLLVMLGGERSAQVRRAVAANPNTPVAVLRSLADDKDEQVRHAVAFNGSTPGPLLAELAGRSIDLAVLVAMNPDVPNAVLDALAQDGSPLVRFVANGNRQAHVLPRNGNTQ